MTTFYSQHISLGSEVLRVRKVQIGLRVLFTLGALSRLNRWLLRRALNNGVTDKTWDWKEKEIVVVTGGSGGIGACMVSQLQAKGVYKIIILDIMPPKSISASSTSAAEITNVVKQIRTDHGDPTVLINNAGIGDPVEITSMDNKYGWGYTLKDLRCQHHCPFSSGSRAFAADAALAFHEGLTQELRLMYKAPLVRTSIVHPSRVRTPLIADLIESGKLEGKTVSPEAVADAAVQQLFGGYGAQIIIPANLTMVSILRGLPIWVQERFRDGVSRTVVSASKTAERNRS
ncbi:hypothetical protein ONS95_002820 [Cadophora gregata]|uniref:uncharacterized protein n=1 Tax=Cadophora gregata TaxID=51156 RepID=UPI0026DB7913|nr:uncharacterized protein ONS95_002820 [Cadophora gregata]KAK0110169.1 hypothetical protein ONS95_002820 [Cadophora gregata]KAK0110216.1 hypothetical protein ONS96_001839 [Cadophora gregata f. sp. sojae]